LFDLTVEQFADCGETDTPYETLMRWANEGLLECGRFTVTEAGRAFLTEGPLFRVEGVSAASALCADSVRTDAPAEASKQPTLPPPAVAYTQYDVDDCMTVAALTAADASKFVRDECGDGCGEITAENVSPKMLIETANIDDGEQRTPTSKRTAKELVDAHLAAGGTLPWTVAYDNY
jgi:hypothetical protein